MFCCCDKKYHDQNQYREGRQFLSWWFQRVRVHKVRRRDCKQEKGIRSERLRDRIPTLNKGDGANYMWGEGTSSQSQPIDRLPSSKAVPPKGFTASASCVTSWGPRIQLTYSGHVFNSDHHSPHSSTYP